MAIAPSDCQSDPRNATVCKIEREVTDLTDRYISDTLYYLMLTTIDRK